MNISVTIHDGPLDPAAPWFIDGVGAMLRFEGLVRPVEGTQPIAGLQYQTYDPMAERELARLGHQAVERFGVLAICVEHSRGQVKNHECSFRLRIASTHRKEGLAAMDWFIDRMKQEVPIWKRPIPITHSHEVAR